MEADGDVPITLSVNYSARSPVLRRGTRDRAATRFFSPGRDAMGPAARHQDVPVTAHHSSL